MWDIIRLLRILVTMMALPHVILEVQKEMPFMQRILDWDPIGGFVIVLACNVGISTILWDLARQSDALLAQELSR